MALETRPSILNAACVVRSFARPIDSNPPEPMFWCAVLAVLSLTIPHAEKNALRFPHQAGRQADWQSRRHFISNFHGKIAWRREGGSTNGGGERGRTVSRICALSPCAYKADRPGTKQKPTRLSNSIVCYVPSCPLLLPGLVVFSELVK